MTGGALSPESIPFPLSLARRAGDVVLTSAVGDHIFRPEDVRHDDTGTVIDDGTGAGTRSVEEQTRGSFRNLEAALRREGCTLQDIVQLTVWLADPRDFAAFNAVCAEVLGDNRPARSVFGVRFMFDVRVEVQAMAHKPLP